MFESDSVNIEEVQSIMEAYESKPQEWMKFAKFDQYRYHYYCCCYCFGLIFISEVLLLFNTFMKNKKIKGYKIK